MLQIIKLNDKLPKNSKTVAIVENSRKEAVAVLRMFEQDDGSQSKLVELPSHLKFVPAPTTEEGSRHVSHITGASGSGKSTCAAAYARHFINTFNLSPEEVFVFSSDDIVDKEFSFPHTFIHLNEEMVQEPIELEELTSANGRSLCIFDDIEGLSNTKVKKATESLLQRVLETGRKRGIDVILISHKSANGNATKYILGELDRFMFFPMYTQGRNLEYTLKNHLSLPDGLKAEFKDPAWGRWICVCTSGLQHIISEKRACILDHDEVNSALKKKSLFNNIKNKQEAKKLLGNF